MRTHVDVFLADPIVTALNLPLIERERMRYVYRFEFVHYRSDQEALEEAFRILNFAHPADYDERSLSVGDVLTIARRRSYRCDWLGWERLDRSVVRPRTMRDVTQWLTARKEGVWPRIGRVLCQLRGCNATRTPACVRCLSFIYDPDFIPPRRWLAKIGDHVRILRRKCLHRCEVCRRCIWFSQEQCCSQSCLEQWLPF